MASTAFALALISPAGIRVERRALMAAMMGYNEPPRAGYDGSCARFLWVKVPTNDELTLLAHTIARRTTRNKCGQCQYKYLLAFSCPLRIPGHHH